MSRLDDLNKKLSLGKDGKTVTDYIAVTPDEIITINMMIVGMIWNVKGGQYGELHEILGISSKLLQKLRNGCLSSDQGARLTNASMGILSGKFNIPVEEIKAGEYCWFPQGWERELVQYRRLLWIYRNRITNSGRIHELLAGIFDKEAAEKLERGLIEHAKRSTAGENVNGTDSEFVEIEKKRLYDVLKKEIQQMYERTGVDDKSSKDQYKRVLFYFKYRNQTVEDEDILKDLTDNLSKWNYERLRGIKKEKLKAYHEKIKEQNILIQAVLISKK